MAENRNDASKGAAGQGQGNGEKKSVQSATLASHTSRPLGGQVTEKKQAGAHEETGGRVRETTARVRHRAEDLYEDAAGWAEDTYDRVAEWASDSYHHQQDRLGSARARSMRSYRRARSGLDGYVRENPMVVGLVGLAAGLVIGALLPRTRRENEVFGEWADDMRHEGMRYAREAAQRGREMVEETFEGEDPRFSKHESEFKNGRADLNRH